MYGSYWDGDAIVCRGCGTRIEDPRPTGYQIQYARPSLLVKLLNWPRKEVDRTPTWPDWILGKQGEPYTGRTFQDKVRGRDKAEC